MKCSGLKANSIKNQPVHPIDEKVTNPVSELGKKHLNEKEKADAAKKKSQKNYVLIAVGVGLVAVISAYAFTKINQYGSGTLSDYDYNLCLDNTVPFLLTDGSLYIARPYFSPKTFILPIALAETWFFMKKATLGISIEDLKTLAKKTRCSTFFKITT